MNESRIGKRNPVRVVQGCGCLVEAMVLLMVACGRPRDDKWLGSGSLEARQVTVAAKLAGQLMGFFVDEGDTVCAGDVIAAVDSSKLVLQRAQLVAAQRELSHNLANARRTVELASEQYENARRQYERVRALAERGSAPQQQLDNAQIAHAAARTQLEAAKNALAALEERGKQLQAQMELLDTQVRDAAVRAPLAGVVVAKYAESGEMVAPGSPLVTIADLRELWVKVYLPEPELGKVSLGVQVAVRADAFPAEVFPGRISWVSPKAEFTPKNVQTRSARSELVYAVKVVVPNDQGRLLVGMPVEVSLSP
ncbi:MAG: HlyD family secretion protein [Candidatus Oleimicrobiaceae bacterium]